jgi:hypothetical protein
MKAIISGFAQMIKLVFLKRLFYHLPKGYFYFSPVRLLTTLAFTDFSSPAGGKKKKAGLIDSLYALF